MKQLYVRDIVDALEDIAPTSVAETWDNVGLIIGDRNAKVSRIMLTIDLGLQQLREAERVGCELVVSYHPPIFKGLRTLLPGHPAYEAVRANMAVYSPPTALDVARDGTNDALAYDAIGMQQCRALKPGPDGINGIGRFGILAPAVPRQELFERIKTTLQVQHLLIAGPRTGTVERAAVCAGACGQLIHHALNLQAELYLTGELRHHDALLAASHHMTVVCTLHSHSERLVLPRIQRKLRELSPSLEVSICAADSDPFDLI